ncbi:MAG TPA: ABC transporter ATP-binding protein [Acidimicrobiales bacterium]|nr:ABC transporter ATP-binding protein [Acidimicrobiales bacterium]
MDGETSRQAVVDAAADATLVTEAATATREQLACTDPVPGVAKPGPILVVDGMRKSFGGLVAVDIDHLEVQRGAITALIGPNGAGKSTLFNLVTGFDAPDHGRWLFGGQDLSGMRAHRIAGHGMVRSFQLTKALARLTVLENMKLAAQAQTGERLLPSLFRPTWQSQEAEIEARADELLARFRLDHMRDEYAGTLSGGQRKLLDMARALMTEPQLVCLDEPMAGVNPVLTESLLQHITGLRDEGLTVIFVEHDMAVVMEISDWVVVLGEGRVIAEGPPQAVATNPAVIDAYLGTDHAARHAPVPIEESRDASEALVAHVPEEAEEGLTP